MKRRSSWFILLVFVIELTPSMSSSSDSYWRERSAIVEEEFSESLGGDLEFEDYEEDANDVLMTAKYAEVDEGFENLTAFLPAQRFLSVATDIKLSKTYQIIRGMPKGAVLHAHDISFVSAEYVFQNITYRDNLYVCLPEDGLIGYRFLKSKDSDSTCATGWELLADLRADETKAEEVNTRVWNSLTLVVSDPATAYPNVDAVWVVANQVFGTLTQLLTYLPVYEDYYYQGLTELYEDNVLWLELRTTFPTLYDLEGTTYDPVQVAGLYKNTTERFVNDNPDFIGAKFIYSPLRIATTSELGNYLEIAKSLVKEFPDDVAGFDLVGQEERGNPLTVYVDELRNISSDIKFFFHAGETQWNGLSTDQNLIDAILLNTTRIGHGFAVLKHPVILKRIKKSDIAIEINPIANQVGTLVGDMRNHPASFLFAENYPVVVSCDDPGLWGSLALSFDFYEAFVGIMSRSADIRALKQLAINSIRYSAMSDDQKTLAYTTWEQKWSTFIINLANSSS